MKYILIILLLMSGCSTLNTYNDTYLYNCTPNKYLPTDYQQGVANEQGISIEYIRLYREDNNCMYLIKFDTPQIQYGTEVWNIERAYNLQCLKTNIGYKDKCIE